MDPFYIKHLMIKVIKKARINIREILLFLSGVYFIFVNLFSYAKETHLGADIVSRVLPAMAPYFGMGIPYRDYWERTPPGHYIAIIAWSKIFGTSMLSYKILHLTLMLGAMILIYVVLKKLLKGWTLYLTCFLAFFITFSTRLISYIVPAELLALVFSLGGLAPLLYIKDFKKRLFLSGFLLTFSGFIKDPFMFSLILFIPVLVDYFIHKKRDVLWAIVYLLLGFVLAISVNLVYLIILGNLNDYLAVVVQKSQSYNVFDFRLLYDRLYIFLQKSKDVFFYFQYSLSSLFIVWLITKTAVAFKKGSLKLFFEGKKPTLRFKTDFKFTPSLGSFYALVFLFYSFGGLVGFVAQGTIDSHYFIQIVFPLITTMSLIAISIYTDLLVLFSGFKYKKETMFMVAFLMIGFFLPKKLYLVDYLSLRISPRSLVEDVLGAERNIDNTKYDYIKSIVPRGGCIESVYGWGVGTAYFYAQRQPCSKYFLAGFVNPKNKAEYVSDITKRAPAVIVYTQGGADVAVETFEESILNYSLILKKCYSQDRVWSDVYIQDFSGMKQSECISRVVSAKI